MNTFKSILIVVVVALSIGATARAQSLDAVDSSVAYAVVGELVYQQADVDVKPEFPGGDKAMYEFMNSNIHYPQDAQKDSIEGTVIVHFTIDEDGSISDAGVVRSPRQSLSEEALRMIKSMPKWIPASRDDKPVKVNLTVPVKFRLNNDIHVFHIDDVDVKPVFPGGDRAMCEFIIKNMRHPMLTQQLDIEGTAVVRFTIEKDGGITDAKAVRSPHNSLSEEAVRLVMSMPAWTPGRKNGQPVRVHYTLPIIFKVFGGGTPNDEIIEKIAATIAAYEPVYELDDLDVQPEFPNGQRAMYEFMNKNLKYPPTEYRQATVLVQFVVGEDGVLTDAQVVFSDHELFSKEVLRVVGLMPTWTPGQRNGKPVKARYLLPARVKTVY